MADSSLVDVEIYNSNCFPGRGGWRPSWVILHATAGGTSAQGIANYFASTQGGAGPVSAHYVIGTDGTIVACNSENDGAWANGSVSAGHDPWWSGTGNPNPNNVTISIEHCKPSSDNSDSLTPAQQDASFRLVADICNRWGIPARSADGNGGITGHFSMDPQNRSRCPGAYPWDELFAFLQNGGDTQMGGVPQGWSDDGTTLVAPNGHKVILGFRARVLQGWDPANWPLEEEHGENPLEISNPSLGSGTQQVFRWTILEWTQGRGVFEAWGGQELLALRAKLESSTPAPAPSPNVADAISTLEAIEIAAQKAVADLKS